MPDIPRSDLAERQLPLSEPVFQILLAVSDQALHGYAMIQDIRSRTDGAVDLTASTLYAALKRLLAERELVREYVALVEGRPPARRGTIDAPLGRDRRVRTRISTDTDEPRAAVTHFEVERALPHDTLLRVRLETGRTHQIRAHLLAIGHPVAGDPEYGAPGRHGLRRQFLHAARLAFPHPVTGAAVDVSSPLPQDLAAALQRAEDGGPVHRR